MFYCKKCNAPHTGGKTGKSKFCSYACSNSRVRSQATKDKISNALQGKPARTKGLVLVARENRNCKACNESFTATLNSQKQYCSRRCGYKSKKLGGYREGSGRSKSGYYKGIFCGSSYELVWVIFCLDNNISFSRFAGYIQDKTTKYFPDFIQDGKIVEIKGYHTKAVDVKTELAKANGYIITVLYKEDIKHCFDWVKRHYNYKNIIELYDDYKPNFSYSCLNCEDVFNTDKKKKTVNVFCSQQCAGQYRQKVLRGHNV